MGMGIYLNIKNIAYFSHSRAPEDLKTPKNVWNHKCVIKKNVCTTGERDFIDSSIKSLFPPWCIIHYNYINKLEVVFKKIAANGLRKKGSQNIVFRRRNARKSERLYPPPPFPTTPRYQDKWPSKKRPNGSIVKKLIFILLFFPLAFFPSAIFSFRFFFHRPFFPAVFPRPFFPVPFFLNFIYPAPRSHTH